MVNPILPSIQETSSLPVLTPADARLAGLRHITHQVHHCAAQAPRAIPDYEIKHHRTWASAVLVALTANANSGRAVRQPQLTMPLLPDLNIARPKHAPHCSPGQQRPHGEDCVGRGRSRSSTPRDGDSGISSTSDPCTMTLCWICSNPLPSSVCWPAGRVPVADR